MYAARTACGRMYGVLVISSRSGACLYSKAHRASFGIQSKDARPCEDHDPDLMHLESMSTASMLYALNLQFASDSKEGVMVCISLDKKLYGPIAKDICEAILEAFTSQNTSFLAQKNPASRAKGFTPCLYNVYQQVPQHIASVIAAKLAPMQLLWVIIAPANKLLRDQKERPPCRWWQLLTKKASVTPLQPVPSQILWTDASCSASFQGQVAHNGRMPGTCSTLGEIMQIVAKTAQRLTLHSSPTAPMGNFLPPYLHSTAVPLKLFQQKADVPPPPHKSDALPNFAVYTPRMIELNINIRDTGKPPGADMGMICASEKGNADVPPNHCLLVMHQSGMIVAVPLILGSSYTSVQQAKAAIIEEVQQLVTVMQSIHSICPSS